MKIFSYIVDESIKESYAFIIRHMQVQKFLCRKAGDIKKEHQYKDVNDINILIYDISLHIYIYIY